MASKCVIISINLSQYSDYSSGSVSSSFHSVQIFCLLLYCVMTVNEFFAVLWRLIVCCVKRMFVFIFCRSLLGPVTVVLACSSDYLVHVEGRWEYLVQSWRSWTLVHCMAHQSNSHCRPKTDFQVVNPIDFDLLLGIGVPMCLSWSRSSWEQFMNYRLVPPLVYGAVS